jgi:hypothetical protein
MHDLPRANENYFLRSTLPLILSFAKTPHEAILVHVTCYAVSLYVIDSTCALDFGEAQPRAAAPTARRPAGRPLWCAKIPSSGFDAM